MAFEWYTFHDYDKDVNIHFRISGGIFNLKRMNAKSLVSEDLMRKPLYAEHADLISHHGCFYKSFLVIKRD